MGYPVGLALSLSLPGSADILTFVLYEKPSRLSIRSLNASAAPAPKPSRRLPQQARSRQRFNQILDAAARTFDEVGYEAATTEMIAVRANTSIGSLYRFFSDKSAILYALAEIHNRCVSCLQTFSPDVSSASSFGSQPCH